MDIAEKIRAEIQLHEAELDRLRTALGVIEQYSGKPVKAAPMITIRKQNTGAPSEDAEASELPLTAQILKMLEGGKALKVHDISKRLDYGNRTKTSASNPINSLKKRGAIISVGNGKYALKGYAGKVKENAKTGVSIRAQVMAAFEAFHHPLSRDDLLNLIDLQGRSLHTFDSCLSKLKLEGVINQDETAKFTLASRQVAADEPDLSGMGESEAA
jgi:hypothetical protein